MEENIKSKRRVKLTMGIAIVLGLLGFAVVIVWAVLEDGALGSAGWFAPVGLIGFFGSEAAALALMLSIFKDVIYHDVQKKTQKYDAAELFRLTDVSPGRIREVLALERFRELDGGYFRKKVFSFAKDFICYYVRMVPSAGVAASVDAEFRRFDEIEEKSQNICLILFLYRDHPGEEDYQALRETDMGLLLNEAVVPVRTARTSVVVLADAEGREGCFLDSGGKVDITVYGYGCRWLRKHFAH